MKSPTAKNRLLEMDRWHLWPILVPYLALMIGFLCFLVPDRPDGSLTMASLANSEKYVVVNGSCDWHRHKVSSVDLEIVREDKKGQAGAAIPVRYPIAPGSEGEAVCSDFYGAYQAGDAISVELDAANPNGQAVLLKNVEFPTDYMTRKDLTHAFSIQKAHDRWIRRDYRDEDQILLRETDVPLLRGKNRRGEWSALAERGEVFTRKIEGSDNFLFLYCHVASNVKELYVKKSIANPISEHSRWCRIIGSPQGYSLNEWQKLGAQCTISFRFTQEMYRLGIDAMESVFKPEQDVSKTETSRDVQRIVCDLRNSLGLITRAMESGSPGVLSDPLKVEDAQLVMEEILKIIEEARDQTSPEWIKPAEKVSELALFMEHERERLESNRVYWEKIKKEDVPGRRNGVSQ